MNLFNRRNAEETVAEPASPQSALTSTTLEESDIQLLSRMRAVCAAAASGDFERRVTGIEDTDILGALAWDINALLDIVNAFAREASASTSHAANGKYFRKILLRGMPGELRLASEKINAATDVMADQATKIAEQRERQLQMASAFETAIGAAIGEVADSASRMQRDAREMSDMAAETSERATNVAAATEEATTNVQAVASAAEELVASINEVSSRASDASNTSKRAHDEADQSGERIQHLRESAPHIDQVVTFINEIASQTNLLALNATIEAARAGEAGKGFAVVASEVKSLASQTAKATEEITVQVNAVQDATQQVVSALQAVGTTIGDISEISTAIAAAVEEQAAATQEISMNVHQAAAGTSQVAEHIVEVNASANKTGDVAKSVMELADGIVERSNLLLDEANRFLEAVRAG